MLRYRLCLKVVRACFLGEVGPVGPQGVGKKQAIHSGEDVESILLCQDSTTSCGRLVLEVRQFAWLEIVCTIGERIRFSGPCAGDLVVCLLVPHFAVAFCNSNEMS